MRKIIKAEDAGYPAEWHEGERFFHTNIQQFPERRISWGWVLYHTAAAVALIGTGAWFFYVVAVFEGL